MPNVYLVATSVNVSKQCSPSVPVQSIDPSTSEHIIPPGSVVWVVLRCDYRASLPNLHAVEVMCFVFLLPASGCFWAIRVARIVYEGTWFISRFHRWIHAQRNVHEVGVVCYRSLVRSTGHGFDFTIVDGTLVLAFGSFHWLPHWWHCTDVT